MSYKVFADGQILCSSDAEELALIDPIVNLEANMAGTFTFKMAPDHPFYDSLVFRTTLIDVYLDDELVFEGVPVSDSTDFYNVKTVECEGDLSFLNDSIQGQAKYTDKSVSSLLTAYLTIHNNESDNFKQFQLGMVTVNGGNSLLRYTNYETTMTEISEDLLENFGGYLRVRHENGVRYLDYLADSPRTSSQVIQIGKNLLDLVQNTSTLNICTVLIPLGAKQDSSSIEGLEERLTIKSVNDNKDFIIGTGAAYYGYVWRTVTWDDVTVASNLLAKGEAYLQDAQWANLVINATAFDLGLAVEDVQKFRILDTIRVVSEPHGLDRNFLLTKLQLDLNHPGNTQITLGSDETLSLSSQTAAMGNEINNQVVTILSSAADNAKQILENATGGNIYFVYDEDGVCVEILIMDTNDIQTATRIWRWNINGLGYSPDGGEHYTVAATMDGALFANFVRTGVLQDAATMGDKFYLNLDTGILRGAFQSLTIAGNTVNQIAAGEVNSFVTGQYATDLANLQSQIDGQIETYFDNYVPTTSNAPANAWTTTALKDDHLGDLFYVIDDPDHGGECYRWVNDNGTYKWQLVEDSAVATALQKAMEALDLADEKRRVFTTTPTTPYDVGDLWVDTQTGEIMYCITAKTAEQAYSAADWSQAGDYVTDGSLTQADIFNRLTNNGQTQGIYLQNNKLYINATYIQSGTLSGIRVEAGSGMIGKWEIDSNRLYKEGVVGEYTYRAALYAPTTLSNLENAAFYVGIKDENDNWDYQIRLQYDGKLIAKNAEITGTIVSSNATITGGTINIATSSLTDDVIQLNYSTGNTKMTPYGIYATNDSSSTKSNYLSDGVEVRNTSNKRIVQIGKRPGYADKGQLVLFDADKSRAFLASGNTGGLLYLYNASNRDVVNLDIDSTYGGTIYLYDNNRTSYARLDKRGLYVYDDATSTGKDYSYVGKRSVSDNTTGAYVITDTSTSVNSLNLEGKHTYVIIAHIDYPTNANGRRGLFVSKTSDSTTPVNKAAQIIQQAASGAYTRMTCSFAYTTGQYPETLYLTAFQTSGTGMMVPSFMEAVCII